MGRVIFERESVGKSGALIYIGKFNSLVSTNNKRNNQRPHVECRQQLQLPVPIHMYLHHENS